MKKYTRKNLNIKRLLEFGDLDIRGVAAQNETLTANEYFSKVEQFITDAPELINSLLSVSQLEESVETLRKLEKKLGVVEQHSLNFAENNKVLKDLETLKNILLEIGCSKSNICIDIDCTLNALKNGDLYLSKKLATDVFSTFSPIFDRTKTAYSAKRFSPSSDKDNEPDATILLKEVLDYLDYEEENRKLRILAVDDVTVVLNTLTSMLSPYYEVFALKNSSQVEKFLTYATPELFLLDIEMSGVNGFDLVPLIRQFEEHKDTPIIFLTGNASFNNLKDAFALGACDFISKPVQHDILLEKIKKNIVRKKAY